jgi:transcriptional regulator with XRE-family HTH domain
LTASSEGFVPWLAILPPDGSCPAPRRMNPIHTDRAQTAIGEGPYLTGPRRNVYPKRMEPESESMPPETQRMIQVLKTSMRVLGFTQQEIERKLGVAPGYVGRVFRGVMQLRFEHVIEISRAMGVEPSEMFQLAFSSTHNPVGEATQRLRGVSDLFRPLSAPEPPPKKVEAPRPSVEDETERIERIVLRTFEKFFASMAKNASGRESAG